MGKLKLICCAGSLCTVWK